MGVVRAVPAWYAAAVPRAGEAVEKGYRSSLVRAGYSRFWNMLFHLRSIGYAVSRCLLSQGTTTGAPVHAAHAPVHTAQLWHSHSTLRPLRLPTPPHHHHHHHAHPKPPLILPPPPHTHTRHPYAHGPGVSRTTTPTRTVPGRVLAMGRVTGLGLPDGLLKRTSRS